MTNMKKQARRGFCFFLMCVMLFTSYAFLGTGLSASAVVESVGGSDSLVRTSLAEIKSVLTGLTYGEYLASHENAAKADTVIDIDIADILTEITDSRGNVVKQTTATVENVSGSDYGTDGNVLLVGDNGKITWNVNIEKSAMYSIVIEYFTGDISVHDADGNVVSQGKSSSIERMLLIDGSVPFKEARSIVLYKSWADHYLVVDENNKAVLDENGNKQYFTSASEKFQEFVKDQANQNSDSKRLFVTDSTGNELRPDKLLNDSWVEKALVDSTGYYDSPLEFYLEEGEHRLTLETVREPIAIKSIKLCTVEQPDSYEAYLEKHASASDYSGSDKIYIQAEYPTATSDRTIYQLNDRSSVITMPQDPALIKMNEIGGEKWQYAGQWIEYTVTVPESGFYIIVPRSKQDVYAGMYTSRKVYINGEVPFAEAANLRFDYSSDWQTNPLSSADGETQYKFYLEEGENTIRFEAVLGDMAEILREVENSLNTINEYYRKILMLTGSDPDEYRDYNFQRIMPDVLRGLVQQADALYAVSDRLAEITGGKGEHSATLDKIALIVEYMGKYPDTIAARLSSLKDQLAALGSWLTSTQNQPLDLDYICLQAPGTEPPEAEAGFFASVWGEIKKFIMSFFSDYNSIGSATDEVTTEELEAAGIEVWTATDRDRAQIIRSLVDDDFAERYGIPVNVQLVVASALMPATLAGTGPDVSMGNTQDTAINYAIRSAVYSLNSTEHGYDFNDFSKYEDNPIYRDILDDVATFDETMERFAPAAAVPLTLYGETYGIPENMSFSMMFYRKDIFVELGIEVPNTWDDFYSIIYKLQSNNLDIGFPTGLTGSTILMYQLGETMYKEGNYDAYMEQYGDILRANGQTYINSDGQEIPKTDGMEINLNSNTALAKFKEVCQLFTMYSFPVTYTFADRFRQGTMPIGIVDYTTYNQLIVFAPEIKGLWEFTPLPGTLDEETNTIDNTTVASVTCMMMMRSVTEANHFSAWVFMQWWSSAEIQSDFCNEMVALLGPSGKQNTANIEALEGMSWSKDELDNLKAQFNAVTCTPEYPGGYIIARYANFAFLDVYNDGDEPVEKLLSYVDDINSELTRKRKEFNLPTADEFPLDQN